MRKLYKHLWLEIRLLIVLVGALAVLGLGTVDLDKAVEVKDFLLAQGWKPAEWNKDGNGNRTSPKLSKDDPFDGLETKIGRLIARRIQCKQRRGTI